MRAITLDEIAEATKIGTRSLKALEDEQFEILPGGIFNKGFVRAYAKYLGLNEEQAVSDYLNTIGEQLLPSEPKIEQIAAQAESARNREALMGLKEQGSGAAWVAFILLILLITGGGAGWKYYQKRMQAREALPPAQVSAAQTTQQPTTSAPTDQTSLPTQDSNTSAAVPTTVTPGVTAQPGTSSNAPAQTIATKSDSTKIPIELQIKVTKPTWISIKTDDQPASTETLKYADEKIVQAQQKVVVTTGNALEVTCNGKPLGVVGENNKRSVLRFTSECVVQ